MVKKETQPNWTSHKGLKTLGEPLRALYGGQFILKKVGCTRKMGGTGHIGVARKLKRQKPIRRPCWQHVRQLMMACSTVMITDVMGNRVPAADDCPGR